MKRWLVPLLLLSLPAAAQNFGNIPGHTVIGNPGTESAPARPLPWSDLVAGAGGIAGPSVSAPNEIASWANATGTALRWGAPAAVTDNHTGSIVADSYAVAGFSRPETHGTGLGQMTAQQIFEWSIGPGGTPAPLYDAVRGVANFTAGSTVLMSDAVAGYVVNSMPRPPPYPSFPVATALLGVGIGDVDGSGTWGVSTILTDNRGQLAGVTHGPRYLFNEFDFNVTSPNTQVTGLLIGGSSPAHPTCCTTGIGLLPLGPGVPWLAFVSSADRAADVLLDVGIRGDPPTSNDSQLINLHYLDALSARQTVSIAQTQGGLEFASSGDPIAASLVLAGPGVFATQAGGGMRVGGRTIATGTAGTADLAGDAAYTLVQIGNHTAPMEIFGPVAMPDIPVSPGGNAVVCVNTANGQIFYGTAGAC